MYIYQIIRRENLNFIIQYFFRYVIIFEKNNSFAFIAQFKVFETVFYTFFLQVNLIKSLFELQN